MLIVCLNAKKGKDAVVIVVVRTIKAACKAAFILMLVSAPSVDVPFIQPYVNFSSLALQL